MKEKYVTPTITSSVIYCHETILASSSSNDDGIDHNKHCAFCHQDGHFAYDCPNMKKGKSLEDDFTVDWTVDW